VSEPLRGKLRWSLGRNRDRSWLMSWTSKRGTPVNTPPRLGTIAADLLNAADNDIDVDYELSPDGSYPVNIRRAGTAWVGAAPPSRDAAREPRPAERPQTRQEASGSAGIGHFHNPYNFIPALPPTETGPLGRDLPVGHKAWFPEHFSGRLTVDIELTTPLIVPDAARARKQGDHTILPLLTETDGKTPKLPVTSFKGALRSAYEAITNSRLAVFQGHGVPLGRRMEAGEGLAMVPARLADSGTLELWMGTLNPRNDAEFRRNCPQADRRPPGNLMYAAWLRRYNRGGSSRAGPAYDPDAIRYPDGTYPRHGEPVVCWLRKAEKTNLSGQARFSYWRVEAIRKGHDFGALPPAGALGNPPASFGNSHRLVAGERPIRAWGYVSVTNQNIGNKHDERVFFVPEGQRPYSIKPGPDRLAEWRLRWSQLVADYKEKAEKIIKRRKGDPDRPETSIPLDTYENRDIGKTALSRHICEADAAQLKPGDLCFARIDRQGRADGLLPVMISRELASIAPVDLLPEALRPAMSLAALSPADRVFGWVRQDGGAGPQGKGAYKGQLRIASLSYAGNENQGEPITRFAAPGLPLAILSTPKPEQARFYVAADQNGTPQRNGIDKEEAAYDAGAAGGGSRKGLRGRKVYPHHRGLPVEYWDGPAALNAAREQPARAQRAGSGFREYVRVATDISALRDDQNRSIDGWVNPGVRFQAEIEVINLSEVELGALLFLLTLPEGCHFRLGGGKPLGFGSAHVRLVALDLRDGAAIRNDLLNLLPRTVAGGKRLTAINAGEAAEVGKAAARAYKEAMVEAYDSGAFEQIPLVKAFLNAARGFTDGRPIHYPRAAAPDWDGRSPVPPNPEGKNYEWFVANDRAGRFDPGLHLALDPLWAPTGLAMLAAREDRGGGHRPSSTARGPAGSGSTGRPYRGDWPR
jgi:CRISPR-associated protein (TIGR03986 family)